MKLTKEQALKTIRDAELTEYLMYMSGVFDVTAHTRCWNMLQHLKRLAEKSTLSEFGEEP